MHNFDPAQLSKDVQDLKAKLELWESQMEKLFPIIPVLLEKYAGEMAGAGATQEAGQIIPATEIGQYHNGDKSKNA